MFNTPDGVKRSAAPRRAEPATRTAHGARQGRRRRGTRGARRGNRRREEPRPAPRATYRRRTAKGDGRRAGRRRGHGSGRRGAAERFTNVNCHDCTHASYRHPAIYNYTRRKITPVLHYRRGSAFYIWKMHIQMRIYICKSSRRRAALPGRRSRPDRRPAPAKGDARGADPAQARRKARETTARRAAPCAGLGLGLTYWRHTAKGDGRRAGLL